MNFVINRITAASQRARFKLISVDIKNNRSYSCLTSFSQRSVHVVSACNTQRYNVPNKNYHAQNSGIFKYLSESAPVEVAQNFLITIHDTTGLPWWGSIILTTITLRSVVTLPLAIYQNYIMAKLQNLRLEMPEIAKELKAETMYAMKKFDWTEKQAKMMFDRSLKKQWDKLVVRDNCHPFKSTLLLWIQIPMWVFVSIALRNLTCMLPTPDLAAQIIYTQMSVGGFLWIPNLTQIDHSFILPVALGIFNLVITELHVLLRPNAQSRLQRYITNFFRIFSICMVPIAALAPSGLCLYWTTSSAFGLFQNLFLLSPKVKRFCRVPQTNSEINKPYEHLLVQIGERFSLFRKK